MASQPEVVQLMGHLRDDNGLENGIRRRHSIQRAERDIVGWKVLRSANYNPSDSMRWLWTTLEENVPSLTSKLPFLIILAPSFLQPSYKYDFKLCSTSWLDGLRGYGALSVYIFHFIGPWFPSIAAGYASGPDFYNLIQLPIVRIVYSGGGMVSVFYVISGYVLSISSIRKIRDGDWTGFLDTLVSSVFRRWMRLYLPIIVSTFITLLISRAGWWAPLGPLGGPPPWETFLPQFQDWAWHFLAISDPTYCYSGESVHNNPYGPQLWTIPREFRGSMVIYLVILGLAKTREGVRFSLLAFLCWYTLWIQQWDLSLFIFGMLLAELHLFGQDLFPGDDKALDKYLPGLFYGYSYAIRQTTSIGLAFLGTYLLSIPTANPRDSPGYSFINAYTPDTYISHNLTHRYWVSIGAALLITGIVLSPFPNSSAQPLLQRPFRSPLAQYLARISFGLYVTHYYTLGTIGSRILIYYGTGAEEQKLYAFLVAVVVNSFLCFWAADLFWRGVDTKSLKIARIVANKCFVRSSGTR
jgi:peptidoglycan/LPS O-acetylase OafA/YrhL